MDALSILAWMRGIERLAIVGLSGLSLILGWDLFRRGVLIAQDAEFKSHLWTVRLLRVGPGIFFALFGTAAFITAIAHPLEVTTGKSSQQLTKGAEVTSLVTETQKLSEDAQVSNSSDRDVIAAINTFHLILLPKVVKSLDAESQSAVTKADQKLDSYKKSLMFEQFGEMSLKFYLIHDQVPTAPGILGKQPQSFQNKYSEIEGWDTDTFLRRR